MKIAGAWLERAETQGVLTLLEQAGHQGLLVGGCVRNALIGAPVGDIDIATDALPQSVIALAQAAGLRVIPTGIAHGTVTVVAGKVAHEVTTFRRDVQTDGRHAMVSFAASLEQDAMRRDFTMNALYARADGTLVDPLGGMPDLLARRVRFVGQPAARIAEDGLRILRFFRFQAWYGDPQQGPDTDGLAACAALSACTDMLSRERVGAEMRKLLSSADPAPAVAAMASAGVLARVLPGADHQSLAPLVHLEQGIAPFWVRRLAVIGGAGPVSALRMSRSAAQDLAVMHKWTGTADRADVLAYRLGALRAHDVLLLRGALFGMSLPPDWEMLLSRGAFARFPVRADDLLPVLQGAALGKRLAELENRWIGSGFTLNRDALLAGPGQT